MKTSAVLLIVLAAAIGPVRAEESSPAVTRIYPVDFADSGSLAEIVRAVVGEDGHVFHDETGRRLVVLADEARHREIADLMGQADSHAGNVRIHVEFREQGREEDSGFGIQGHGEVVATPHGTDAHITLQPHVRHRTTDTQSDTSQMLMVASGRSGVLRVGEQVPYADWLVEYGWHHGFITSRIQWQEVGSFLIVEPAILSDGETVRIRSTPELRGLVNGDPHHARFAGLTTEVLVRNGETFSIGGTAHDQEFYSRYLIGLDRRGTQRSLDILLTPHIVKGTRP